MAHPLHLYVHVPFCERKCPYCHFYNIGHDDGREALYLDGTAREIAHLRADGAFDRMRLATLYWGGGTPSLLSDQATERLAGLCLGTAPKGDSFEWTIEVNPADATPERLARYLDRGVTRVSVGVQSFDDRRLAFLGRNHDADRARSALAAALAAGFDDVSLDLIFNLSFPADPSERRRAWAKDLAEAFAHPISHLSLYGLTLEPGTAFDARARGGELLTISDPAYAAEYRAACGAARRAGFEHYEVSSFARRDPAGGGYRRSRHNAAYWSGASYLGLGPAAHSFDGVHRWANAASLVAWADALSTGGDPRAFSEMLTPAQRCLETLYLGLRTREGVPADHPLLAAARPLVAALLGQGLLVERGARIGCTEPGFAVLDGILDRLAIDAVSTPS